MMTDFDMTESPIEEYLRKFCECDGVSGYEHEGEDCIANLIIEKIRPDCDEAYIDRAGNIIALKKGRESGGQKLLFAAHMDEVGFAVKYINDDGTLLFDDIGISPSAMPCRYVRIGENKVPGIIGMTPVHLVSRAEREKPVSADSLYIDIGAKSREEAEKLVSLGDCAAFGGEYEFLSERRVRSKAIDDRIGCAILCRLIAESTAHKNDIYFAFTVGEELGTLGACAAANEIKPDLVFVVEATTASDIPGCEGRDRVCSLGMGAAVPTMDGGTSYDKALGESVRLLAKENGVAVQNKLKVAGGTDARTFQRASGGARVLGLALPCRYIHTASCVADVGDMRELERLLRLIARKFGDGEPDVRTFEGKAE